MAHIHGPHCAVCEDTANSQENELTTVDQQAQYDYETGNVAWYFNETTD